MKEVWSKAWKKALIWACGYFSLIAFAVAGGYVIVKSQDEELKRTAWHCFVVTLLFMAASALMSILSSINGLSYSAGFSEAIQWINFLLLLAKTAVYATAIVMALVSGKSRGSAQSGAEKAEKSAVSAEAGGDKDAPEEKSREESSEKAAK